MLAHSFSKKNDLDRLLQPAIRYQDYADALEQLYETFCAQALSFVLLDARTLRIVGAALNTDAHCQSYGKVGKIGVANAYGKFAKMKMLTGCSSSSSNCSVLRHVKAYTHELHELQARALPTTAKGQLFHSGFMGTSARLTPPENVAAMLRMEWEVLRLARERGFAGVIATNTSPLTQQLATHVNGYETMSKSQVNRWQTEDGRRPFAGAPDEQAALVQWKRLVE